MKKKTLAYIVSALIFGTVFVYWPRGTQSIEIYNSCSAQVCEPWYSGSTELPVRGIPFKTYLGTRNLDAARFNSDESLLHQSTLKAAINFLTGFCAGIAIIGLYNANNTLRKK